MDPPLDDFELLNACPQCGGKRFRLWRRGRDRLLNVSKQAFPYVKCLGCGVYFLKNRPTPASMARFYPFDYYPYSAPAAAAREGGRVSFIERLLEKVETPRLRNFRVRRLERILQRHPDRQPEAMKTFYAPPAPGAALLDFGCGSPWFLDRLRAQGWETLGMDLTEEVVADVNKAGHRGIVISESGWSQIPDASLDMVRMNHVLEHLYFPPQVLSMILRKMKPGAGIHIAVPNPRGMSSLLFGNCWFGFEAPRHLVLNTRDSLVKLAADVGFDRIEVHHERSPKDFARSLGYFLSDMKLIAPGVAFPMGEEPLINGWLSLLTFVAGAHGYGDRMHLFARRKE